MTSARRAIAALPVRSLRASYFTTFWLAREALEQAQGPGSRARAQHRRAGPQPLSPIERLVARLWPLAEPSPACTGVEWWVGRAYTNALPIGFHFDQDVKALRGFRHPLLSSVFFFNRVRGGQLAVTDQLAGGRGEPLPARASALDTASPRRNRYVVFRGDRFHGVLDAEGRTPGRAARTPAGRLRVTLVINFWSRRPTGVPAFSP